MTVKTTKNQPSSSIFLSNDKIRQACVKLEKTHKHWPGYEEIYRRWASCTSWQAVETSSASPGKRNKDYRMPAKLAVKSHPKRCSFFKLEVYEPRIQLDLKTFLSFPSSPIENSDFRRRRRERKSQTQMGSSQSNAQPCNSKCGSHMTSKYLKGPNRNNVEMITSKKCRENGLWDNCRNQLNFDNCI